MKPSRKAQARAIDVLAGIPLAQHAGEPFDCGMFGHSGCERVSRVDGEFWLVHHPSDIGEATSSPWMFQSDPPLASLDVSAIVRQMSLLEEKAYRDAVISKLRSLGYSVIKLPASEARL